MPIDKILADADRAVADIGDGAIILVGGFGGAGSPTRLLEALARRRLSDLTIVSNNAGTGRTGLAAVLASGAVRKLCCSYPRSSGSVVFDELYAAGSVELELIPQGTLSERIRAAGAGIAAFYTPVGVDTELGEGREQRIIGDRAYLLEHALPGDFALIKGLRADRWGNMTYDKAARNFGPTMAMAGQITIAEVDELVPLGDLDPEVIVTPGVFVQRVVRS